VEKRESFDPAAVWEYVHTLHIVNDHPTRTPEVTELDGILRKVAAKAQQAQYGRWTLSEVDEEKYSPHIAIEGDEDIDEFGYVAVTLPDNFDDFFSHLYGLDAQITRVRRAIELGILTNWSERKNTVLYGPPGCGKSDITLSLKQALGEEAVWSLDATAMTGAGVIKELAEREVLPRVLVVEEIEKANEEVLRFFLGMLDQRGEIRKTTARGNIQRDTKLFAVVTVNDIDKFRKLMSGALSSRCKNEVSFNRPSREVLTAILQRDVKRMNGDLAWCEPAIDFCEEMGMHDVREVQTHCLCGREMLLTGEYQEMVKATSPKADIEQETK
jgi:energy-coupling factor transporter ATP-binding protein EcfA2